MEGRGLDKEIGFIARYYKEGLFNAEKALKKIGLKAGWVWTWPRIAAASCIIVVLGATAGLLIRNSYYSDTEIKMEAPVGTHSPIESVTMAIDFDDTPLPVVIEQINLTYHVEIGNIPANAEDYRLSLHYEGNVIELIESINEILGINLEVER